MQRNFLSLFETPLEFAIGSTRRTGKAHLLSSK
jgi:hypothetical protein